ncbi:MAG: PHP domain-containing protein [Halodesulfurarchaeum sp.]|nr:PHP domain-containing protein [Halodesulfurarchaeum sp.]
MVYADLHVHTRNSDGQLSIDEIPPAARAADLAVVAVTDHDRVHPVLEAPVVELDGITVVHGIELRVETPVQRVDLLGYGLEPTPELRVETERIGADRVRRGREIVSCLEAELGVELDISIGERTGRPHIARAVVAHPETAYESIEAVFEDLIGDGRPCFVSRDVPTFERGVALLTEAAQVVGLAHPFRYSDPAAALERCAALDAVERYYPYDRPVTGEPIVDESLLESTIAEYDLLLTGGSDAHGTELGAAGLDPDEYREFEAALSPEP